VIFILLETWIQVDESHNYGISILDKSRRCLSAASLAAFLNRIFRIDVTHNAESPASIIKITTENPPIN